MTLEQEKKAFIEEYLKTQNRDTLTESEERQINAEFDPIVPTDIDLRKREVDIRKLTTKDYKQLMYRNSCDIIAYLKFLNQNINDLVLLKVLELKKQGIEDPLGEIEELVKNEIK